jgi:membrane-associated PAP2 superfamily phosphatase
VSRAALIVALSIGFVAGLICAVDPQLDLDLAAIGFDSSRHMFVVNAQPWVQYIRQAARIVITLLALPAFTAIAFKLIWPQRPMLIQARAAFFLIATLALGPGLITNLILKDHLGRPRPIDVQQFGGDDHFEPWWDPRGNCSNNCSFVAGEPSGAFWTLAPAALAPPPLQAVAYGAALTFGIALGAFRMAAGAHFFSDVVFSGVLMYVLIWAMHGLIYRWPATRLDEKAVEDWLARAGERLTGAVRRLWSRAKKAS